jgi:6-phosphogluconolactonase (cycloisomerase 2 family)
MSRISVLARSIAVAAILAVGAIVTAPVAGASSAVVGHVYVQTNDPSGNAVIAFDRAADGTLTYAGTVSTGGLGYTASLGSQAALAATADERHLLVVNGGSDDVSLFDITRHGLELEDIRGVGDRPVSVTVWGSLVYVLNQGGDSIQALRIKDGDRLVDVRHSTRSLSGTAVNAAQVAFGPDGRILAVTEKDTAIIDTFKVRHNGRARGPKVQASNGLTPFGFQFGPDGRLYVSEAPTSSASSYDVASNGRLRVISGSVPNGRGAACWLVVRDDGRFAYTANAATNDVSSYRIRRDGSLTLDEGVAGTTGAGPVDMDLSDGDGFLYVLNRAGGSISAFEVLGDGSLSPVAGATGVGTTDNGIVAI